MANQGIDGNAEGFRSSYVRKEAALSFQNEGSEISISDLQIYENDEMPGFTLASTNGLAIAGANLDSDAI